MDEINTFRDLVETASRRPSGIADVRDAVWRRIREAEAALPFADQPVFPLTRDMFFRVASAAMATIAVGLGLGYYSLSGMSSGWTLDYYEIVGGIASFWGVF